MNKNNNKMKKFLSILAVVLITFSANAQDKKAKDLLDDVTKKIKSYSNIVIDFKYSLNNSKENINVNLEFNEDDTFMNFKVIDNGNGIAPENFKKIFDLFEVVDYNDSEKERGSGIGLATVLKVVESLGGTISVDSKVGVGSTFSFSIAK